MTAVPRGGANDPTGAYPGRIIHVITNELDPKTVAAVAYQAGFRGTAWTTAVAVSFAENGRHDATAQHLNTDNSVDTGLWQINSVHGLAIRDLFEPQYNANAAFRISSGGRNWSPWTTYPALSLVQMPVAQAVIADLKRHGGAVKWLQNNPIGTTPNIPGSVNSPNIVHQIGGTALGQLLSNLLSRGFWIRVLEIVGGLALLFGALFIVGKTVA